MLDPPKGRPPNSRGDAASRQTVRTANTDSSLTDQLLWCMQNRIADHRAFLRTCWHRKSRVDLIKHVAMFVKTASSIVLSVKDSALQSPDEVGLYINDTCQGSVGNRVENNVSTVKKVLQNTSSGLLRVVFFYSTDRLHKYMILKISLRNGFHARTVVRQTQPIDSQDVQDRCPWNLKLRGLREASRMRQ